MLQKLLTLLFISGDPISIEALATLSGESIDNVSMTLRQIKDYLNQGGLDLLINQGEISIVTRSEFAPLIENFWAKELSGPLTPATLQVLTLVAYLGNSTRQDISFIRGVQSSQSIRTLAVRGLLRRDGEVCTLTSDSLKALGVTSVEDLPEYATLHKELLEKLETARKE